MSLRNSYTSYGWLAKLFHWTTVLGFVALYVIGFYMTSLPLGPEMFEKIALHKSIGMVVLFLAVLRLAWRFINPVPDLPDNMEWYERLAAHVTHLLLYGIMLIMPLSGWAMSSAANFPVSVFGWFTMPAIIEPSKAAVENLKAFHGIFAWVILAIIAMHVLAALKHHFINKDDVLKRMFVFALAFLLTAPAMAKDWTVNADSKLGFFATQAGAEFEGGFKKFDSTIKFDPNDLAASKVAITIDIASVDTQSADRDANITTKDWFDTQSFPTSKFETTEISSDGKGAYIAKASLTMRGVTKDVELPFSVDISGAKAHAKGELTVSRTDYGIGQGQWAASTVVGDDVRIFFDLKAHAQ